MIGQALLVAAISLVSPCAAQAPAPRMAPGVAPVPQVTLLQAGESPRQLLRLAPRVGKSQAFDVTVRMESTQSMGGEEMPASAMPGLKFSFRTSVREISPAGEIRYDVECTGAEALDAPGADPSLVAQMREVYQGLTGVRGNGSVTDRGVSRGVALDIPADLNPDLLTQVRNLERLVDQPLPLPEEPVGPGGSWQSQTSLEDQGIPVTQVCVYTLAGCDGTTLQIDLNISQEAAVPEFADGDVRLASYTSRGSGRVRLRLDEAFPSQASSDVVNQSTWVLEQAGQRQQMFQRTRKMEELATTRASSP